MENVEQFLITNEPQGNFKGIKFLTCLICLNLLLGKMNAFFLQCFVVFRPIKYACIKMTIFFFDNDINLIKYIQSCLLLPSIRLFGINCSPTFIKGLYSVEKLIPCLRIYGHHDYKKNC